MWTKCEPNLFLPKNKKRQESQNSCRSKVKIGGDKEDRTPDLLNAIQALSQLSYAPILGFLSNAFTILTRNRPLVKKNLILNITQAF